MLSCFIISGLSHRTHVELPFYSKYLLIAAYLASYNPAKTDRKFFAKHSGKVNKRAQMSAASKKERVRLALLLLLLYPIYIRILGHIESRFPSFSQSQETFKKIFLA